MKRAAAALLLALLPCSLASAGIIELGRKGQLASGSSFAVVVDGITFSDPNHVAGEDASVILERIRAQIDATAAYVAVTVSNPNDTTLNAIQITTATAAEPTSLKVDVSDANIGGGSVYFGSAGGAIATVAGADAVAGNAGGTFEIDITLTTGPLFTQIVTTPGKLVGTVNAEMVAALTGNGFTVTGPAGGPWNISRAGFNLARVQMRRTDTGITVTSVRHVSTTGALPGGGVTVPAVSEWGLLFLAVLGALGAVRLLQARP